MQKLDLKDKKCGTCRFWQGEREISFWLKKPYKVDCADKGNCPCVKAPRSPRLSCKEWIPWEKLI